MLKTCEALIFPALDFAKVVAAVVEVEVVVVEGVAKLLVRRFQT